LPGFINRAGRRTRSRKGAAARRSTCCRKKKEQAAMTLGRGRVRIAEERCNCSFAIDSRREAKSRDVTMLKEE
jgi:hypothetical protein